MRGGRKKVVAPQSTLERGAFCFFNFLLKSKI